MNRLALSILLILILVGCNELKPHGAAPEGADGISPSETVPPPPVFPHPLGWEEATSHGVWALQYGREVCFRCHQVQNDGRSTLPTCNSCHPQFPHESGWADPQHHGRWVIQNGNTSCAGQCHGADLQGGLSRISCNNCHEIYPHPAGWKEPTAHGETARTQGKGLCRSCHGEDLSGAETGVSCTQCHTIYPHMENWKEPSQHGATVTQNGTGSCRTACHGPDLAGGMTGVSCNLCHNVYPHPAGWGSGLQHGTAALDGIGTCKSCHGAGLDRSPTGGPTCKSCHPSFLRHPQAAMTTDDPDWGSPEGHGRYFLEIPNHQESSECQLCHGEDLRGGISGKSCTSCHAVFPHPNGWGNPTGEESHTRVVLEGGFNPCRTACHGADFKGGLSGVSCGAAGCHEIFPHESGWRKWSRHGRRFVEKLAAGEGRPCLGCHGEDYRGGPSQISCDRCHPRSHIPGEWRDFESHGAAWREDQEEGVDRCSRCHGEPVGFSDSYAGVPRDKKDPAPPCYQCHPAFPHISYRTSATYPWEGENGAAHLRFIMRNRHLLTGTSLDDPKLVKSIRVTCARAGGCHSDGRFSTARENESAACTEVCHQE